MMEKRTMTLRMGLLGSALMACTSLVLPSQVFGAAEEAQAQTGWAISRVASVAQGSYCTMAQKFSGNTVVTIAQNAGGEYSLAFDFQSPRFTAGEKVTASLKSGAGAAQTFDVQPSSPQTLVVSLGGNGGLIEELKTSGKLQLEVGGDSLGFATAKFAEGTEELATCLSAMAASAKPKSEEEKPVTVAAQELEEKEAAAAQKDGMKSVLSPVASAPPAVSAEQILAASSQSLGSQSLPDVKVEPLVEETERADKPIPVAEAIDVKAEKKAEEDVKKANAELQQINRDLDALRSENTTLKNQIKIGSSVKEGQKNAAASELAELRSENSALKKTASDLSQQLTAQQQKAATPATVPVKDPVLEQENAYLKSENTRLMKELSSAQTSETAATSSGDDKLQDQLRKLRSQIAALEAENKSLQDSYEKVQKDVEATQLKATGGSWDLEQATKRYQESQREIRRLGAMLEQQNAQCQQEKKSLEYMLFDPEVAEAAQVAMLNSLEGQIAQKDQEIAALKKAETAMTSKIEEARAQGRNEAAQSTLVADLKKQLGDKAAAVSSLESEITGLKSELAAKEKEIGTQKAEVGEISALRAQISLLKAEVAAKANENQKLGSDQMTTISALKAETSQIPALQAQISSLKAEVAAKTSENQKLGSDQMTTISALKAEVTGKTAKIAELEGKLAQMTTEAAQAKAVASKSPDPATVQAQGVAIQSLKDQVAQKDQRLKEMETQAEMLRARIAAQLADQVATKAEPAAGYVAPVPAPATAPVAITPQPAALAPANPVAPAAPAIAFLSAQDIGGMLQQAGISVRSAVQPLPSGASTTYKAYSWKTDSLYGSAEQRTLPDSSGFVPAIQQYLSRAKSRCQGEFAAIPATMKGAGQSAGYEIACVGTGSGTSASVLFSYKDGILTTVAHEGRAEAMDLAMDARDRIAGALLK